MRIIAALLLSHRSSTRGRRTMRDCIIRFPFVVLLQLILLQCWFSRVSTVLTHAFIIPPTTSSPRMIRRTATTTTTTIKNVQHEERKSIFGVTTTHSSRATTGSSELYLFKRLRNSLSSSNKGGGEKDGGNDNNNNDDDDEDEKETTTTTTTLKPAEVAATTLAEMSASSDETPSTEPTTTTTSSTATAVVERPPDTTASASTTAAPAPPSNEIDKLRKEASKMRMEAERMEILLTLQKIDGLEKKIKEATRKGKEEEILSVEAQIDSLRRKLAQDSSTKAKKSVPTVKTDSFDIASFSSKDQDNNANDNDNNSNDSSFSSSSTRSTADDSTTEIPPLSDDEIAKRVEQFESVPKFLQLLVAKAAGFNNDLSNSTAIVLKMHADEVEMESLLETTASGKQKVIIKGKKNNSETSKGLAGLVKDLEAEASDEDRIETMMESLYPKSLREYNNDKSEIVNPMPSETDIQDFIKVINQPKTFLAQTKPPEKTSMGYIVRGVNKLENGTALVDELDNLIQQKQPSLSSKLRYWYLNDPTPVTEEQVLTGERDPIILVSGMNSIGPDSPYEKFQWRVGRSLITMMGIFTTVFYTVFPFFFNEKVASRVDDILNLAGSQQIMTSDLAWFTELQSPLLASMLAIIAIHELGHWLVALSSESKFQISFPTLAPSPIFGCMSSITRLKTSPKNRAELMDFALAGPWAGIAVSSLLLSKGLDLTLSASPQVAEYFPALPTSFIQASSLIASVVDSSLNNGVLNTNIDPATPVYLHPLAIAGYAGLMINALNLTPFGRTDGGRIALCMFGRSGAQILSLITLVTLLLAGFVGNDSFLTYFLFASFFQGELEIPLRDESDELDVSRIVLGLITAAFVLLTLIPV